MRHNASRVIRNVKTSGNGEKDLRIIPYASRFNPRLSYLFAIEPTNLQIDFIAGLHFIDFAVRHVENSI